jgi:hypothetical protein
LAAHYLPAMAALPPKRPQPSFVIRVFNLRMTAEALDSYGIEATLGVRAGIAR